MAARTKIIKRTQDMGLTLKMQPAPCQPAPTAAGWYNPSTMAYDLQTATAELTLDTTSALAVAQVNGPLCDCTVEWSIQWEPTQEDQVE